MSSVLAVLRYPLKSAGGEHLTAVDVDVHGPSGDRRWACVDAADGTLGSAKHPGRWGALQDVSARTLPDGGVEVEVAGHRAVAGTVEAGALLSGHLGRPVTLTRSRPDGARLHRLLPDDPGLLPPWMAEHRPGEQLVTPLAGSGRFVDFGPVHLLTTGALAGLARGLGRDTVDAGRFRPNLVLDAPADPLPGHVLTVGGAVLRVSIPTPRCIVPGLADGDLDRPLLGLLAREHRVPVGDLGVAACFGVYADVLEPGRIAVGDPVAQQP